MDWGAHRETALTRETRLTWRVPACIYPASPWIMPLLMNASVFSNQASANSFASSPPVSKLTTTRPEPDGSAAGS